MSWDTLASDLLFSKSSSTPTSPRRLLSGYARFITLPLPPTLPSDLRATSSSASTRVLLVYCNTTLLALLLRRTTRVRIWQCFKNTTFSSHHLDQGTAQVLLRWAVQQGLAVIPKSNNHDRLLSNLDIVAWSLSDEEMKAISALNINLRVSVIILPTSLASSLIPNLSSSTTLLTSTLAWISSPKYI